LREIAQTDADVANTRFLRLSACHRNANKQGDL